MSAHEPVEHAIASLQDSVGEGVVDVEVAKKKLPYSSKKTLMETVCTSALTKIPAEPRLHDDEHLHIDVQDAENEPVAVPEDTAMRGKHNLKIDEVNERVMIKRTFANIVA